MCKASLKSQIVRLNSYLEHDRITADTQAVTHLAFLSMGTGIFLPLALTLWLWDFHFPKSKGLFWYKFLHLKSFFSEAFVV